MAPKGAAEQTELGREVDFDFVLDRDAEVPIGVQLAWALRTRISDGRLKPGARLPGLRELAEALGINANTARAVYQRLEHEGIIDCQQGSGSFVAQAPQRSSAAGAIAANAAAEAHETGVDPREVAAALYVAPDSSKSSVSDETRRRRQLRTQITALERTLAEFEANHPSLAAKPAKARADAGPRLLDTKELEHLQSELIRRLAAIQISIDKLGQAPSVGEKQSVRPTPAPKRVSRAPAKTRPAPAGA